MLSKLIKYFAYVVFIYQFIDLTIDYLEFKFLIEINFDKSKVLPSATICFNVEKFFKNPRSYYNTKVLVDPDTLTCGKFSGQVFARRTNNSLCYTYFYDQRNEQGKIFSYATIILSDLDPARLIFHPHWTPSHFERINRFNLEQGEIHFGFKRIRTQLLPHPYSTDCYDYSSNIANNFGPKSQKECILEEMKRKERQVCGKYFYWNQIHRNRTNQYLTENINCSAIKFDKRSAKRCKIDCT